MISIKTHYIEMQKIDSRHFDIDEKSYLQAQVTSTSQNDCNIVTSAGQPRGQKSRSEDANRALWNNQCDAPYFASPWSGNRPVVP